MMLSTNPFSFQLFSQGWSFTLKNMNTKNWRVLEHPQRRIPQNPNQPMESLFMMRKWPQREVTELVSDGVGIRARALDSFSKLPPQIGRQVVQMGRGTYSLLHSKKIHSLGCTNLYKMQWQWDLLELSSGPVQAIPQA